MALQVSQNLPVNYFVLRAGVCTSYYRLKSVVVQTSCTYNTKISQNLRNLQCYIFRISQHFATKLCSVTNFKMIFLAVVMELIRSSCLD